ncbi:MAG: hypothetical protein RMY28_030690 [Nostoc sp. ChiSLP01]|nr:hypothetical protein [Nostoc sp. CmiSLP01]MDZ8283532.1 hypothetical protein [Nostoc sp. ChiSLP01]
MIILHSKSQSSKFKIKSCAIAESNTPKPLVGALSMSQREKQCRDVALLRLYKGSG